MPKIVIKKYSDRRLYDTAARRYVKLEDIARLIREGREVEVRDERSGKDITNVILSQIVMDGAREGTGGVPQELLRQLVMASDRATRELLHWYLDHTLDLYRKTQERLRSGLSDARQAVSSPVEFLRNLVGGAPEEEEIAQLRRRVEELEATLAGKKKTQRRRPKSGSAR